MPGAGEKLPAVPGAESRDRGDPRPRRLLLSLLPGPILALGRFRTARPPCARPRRAVQKRRTQRHCSSAVRAKREGSPCSDLAAPLDVPGERGGMRGAGGTESQRCPSQGSLPPKLTRRKPPLPEPGDEISVEPLHQNLTEQKASALRRRHPDPGAPLRRGGTEARVPSPRGERCKARVYHRPGLNLDSDPTPTPGRQR